MAISGIGLMLHTQQDVFIDPTSAGTSRMGPGARLLMDPRWSWLKRLWFSLQRSFSWLLPSPQRQPTGFPGPGDRIINSRGIPGTLGCIAYSADSGEPVFLSAYHVLHGENAEKHESVWSPRQGDADCLAYLGKSLGGKIGVVAHQGGQTFIDCALVGLNSPPEEVFSRGDKTSIPAITGMAEAALGLRVKKLGHATRCTEGIIRSLAYSQACRVNGDIHQAINQILIGSAVAGARFCEKGDSGAVVLNDDGGIVGLLWGVTDQGEGIACPISPVAEELKIRFGAGSRR